MATYGSPLLQALVGLRADGVEARGHGERDRARQAPMELKLADLDKRIEQGSPIEAALRALIYVRRPEKSFDERSFTILKEINSEQQPSRRVSLGRFKKLIEEQFLIMRQNEERAVAAIPKLLPADHEERNALIGAIRRVIFSGGAPKEEGKRRLARIETLFGEPIAQSSGVTKQHSASAA